MKSRYITPFKKKYFHTKPKFDSKDSTYLKNRIYLINKRKLKRKEQNEL